eukprot:TRINITY_DN6271_c0_g2_i2.p1 TRINITY_DN6271_c0_g2~~TRINITY_DN6271_c0_g2_i2.p1  ORF type:complete len:895 (-),score=119.71 TRINITY_DN6271_c0_g2_i2:104-2551(-)
MKLSMAGSQRSSNGSRPTRDDYQSEQDGASEMIGPVDEVARPSGRTSGARRSSGGASAYARPSHEMDADTEVSRDPARESAAWERASRSFGGSRGDSRVLARESGCEAVEEAPSPTRGASGRSLSCKSGATSPEAEGAPSPSRHASERTSDTSRASTTHYDYGDHAASGVRTVKRGEHTIRYDEDGYPIVPPHMRQPSDYIPFDEEVSETEVRHPVDKSFAKRSARQEANEQLRSSGNRPGDETTRGSLAQERTDSFDETTETRQSVNSPGVSKLSSTRDSLQDRNHMREKVSSRVSGSQSIREGSRHSEHLSMRDGSRAQYEDEVSDDMRISSDTSEPRRSSGRRPPSEVSRVSHAEEGTDVFNESAGTWQSVRSSGKQSRLPSCREESMEDERPTHVRERADSHVSRSQSVREGSRHSEQVSKRDGSRAQCEDDVSDDMRISSDTSEPRRSSGKRPPSAVSRVSHTEEGTDVFNESAGTWQPVHSSSKQSRLPSCRESMEDDRPTHVRERADSHVSRSQSMREGSRHSDQLSRRDGSYDQYEDEVREDMRKVSGARQPLRSSGGRPNDDVRGDRHADEGTDVYNEASGAWQSLRSPGQQSKLTSGHPRPSDRVQSYRESSRRSHAIEETEGMDDDAGARQDRRKSSEVARESGRNSSISGRGSGYSEVVNEDASSRRFTQPLEYEPEARSMSSNASGPRSSRPSGAPQDDAAGRRSSGGRSSGAGRASGGQREPARSRSSSLEESVYYDRKSKTWQTRGAEESRPSDGRRSTGGGGSVARGSMQPSQSKAPSGTSRVSTEPAISEMSRSSMWA